MGLDLDRLGQEVTKYIVQPDLVSQLNGEVMVGMEPWNAIGDDLKATFNEVVRATSADASAHFLHQDLVRKDEFVNELGGEITNLDPAVVEELRVKSMEVVDEFAERDPDYSGRVAELLHEFMRLTGKA